MTTRDTAPIGAPCWTDLWTSDVEGSRRFYSELFGWEAQEPDPTHGGYFMFTREGVPVAGGMGPMGDQGADNSWKIYFATDDMAKTIETAEGEGAQIVVPGMPVDELGIQAILVDPTGAPLGAWQPGTFPGFTVLDEPGTPSWFELATRDHDGAVAFYRSVFRLQADPIPGEHEFQYSTVKSTSGGAELGGIMGAASFLPDNVAARWSTYWQVADVDATLKNLSKLGGSIEAGPEDSPYGRIASVTDPTGAHFKLRTPNDA